MQRSPGRAGHWVVGHGLGRDDRPAAGLRLSQSSSCRIDTSGCEPGGGRLERARKRPALSHGAADHLARILLRQGAQARAGQTTTISNSASGHLSNFRGSPVAERGRLQSPRSVSSGDDAAAPLGRTRGERRRQNDRPETQGQGCERRHFEQQRRNPGDRLPPRPVRWASRPMRVSALRKKQL